VEGTDSGIKKDGLGECKRVEKEEKGKVRCKRYKERAKGSANIEAKEHIECSEHRRYWRGTKNRPKREKRGHRRLIGEERGRKIKKEIRKMTKKSEETAVKYSIRYSIPGWA